ncbi:MAG: hypothetical protein M1822_008419 [Bathelium mastoideum]|nr:MAG: hypothetical protein M1822_008419 [Bathelium mastoideum]
MPEGVFPRRPIGVVRGSPSAHRPLLGFRVANPQYTGRRFQALLSASVALPRCTVQYLPKSSAGEMTPGPGKSNRRAGANRIRGPHSALTDFLAANNISAAQIRDDYTRRRQQAETGAVDNDSADAEAAAAQAQEDEDAATAEQLAAEEAAEKTRKRKRNEKETAAAIKKAKESSKKKAKKGKKAKDPDGDSDDDYGDDGFAKDMYKKARPPPGQLENCEICSKRFTVTPYSKTGPDGGLVCTKCGKDLAADDKAEKKKPKGPQGKKRRKVESDRLDGFITHGAKSLQHLCIQKVAENHQDLEELGDLPPTVMQRLSQIFTKKRVMDSKTLKLFLRPDLDTIAIHDCAKIEEDDLKQVFAVIPNVENVILGNAHAFKDEVMEYMLEKASKLKHLHLYGANLVTDKMWLKFFCERGSQLEALKLKDLDSSFGEEVFNAMVSNCHNLHRLKLKFCRRVGAPALEALTSLPAGTLRHLSLYLTSEVPPETLVDLIEHHGPYLETLSLEHFLDAEDTVLAALHTHARRLRKLRFADNDRATDAAFTSLFTGWANPPLHHVDLSATRDVDNNNPTGPLNAPVGLADAGFAALMRHSAIQLRHLDVASCRHVSRAAWSAAFDPGDPQCRYPELRSLNVSFCNEVDTSVVAGVFRCAPKLEKVVAFGCFKVEDVVVPRGITLIGVPRAQDAIEHVGEGMWVGDGKLEAKGLVEVVA